MNMNLQSDLLQLALVILGIIMFPIRELFIRKRIIKIHDQLRKSFPLKTKTIDLTGLQPVIKYSTTEQILGKIETHLNEMKK